MRRWLSLYALSITSIVILAFLVPLAVLVRDLAADRAMTAAEREAQTVSRFAGTLDGDPDAVATLEATLAAVPNTSLRLSDGSVIGADLPSGVEVSAAIERGQAYQQSLDEGRAVVVPVLRGSGDPWVVVVAVPSATLNRDVGPAWAVLTLLGVGLVALALVVADRMGRAVVMPINDLVEATDRLGRGEVTVAVDPAGPSELAKVGTAFNVLTGRVRALMERERETAADLSHRLRTPLTALKLDIEALGQTTDVSRLQRDVDDLERVVSHVINEARRSARDGAGTVADLAAAVENRAAYWGSLAEDQGREWALDAQPGRYRVVGSELELDAMMDAILGNVFAHTPAGTGFNVRLKASSEGIAELSVADEGSGISDPTLLERGTSGGASTGLGVDIVRRTAETAGGSAQWDSGEGSGTVVTVMMPLVDAVR